MVDFKNAAPQFMYDGINDQSTRQVDREPLTYPQHLPLVRLFTETGPTTTTFINNDSGDFNSLFGSKTLSRRGKFFNLQSLLVEKLLARGNGIAVKRLVPEDAAKPRICVAIDIVKDRIPTPVERLDGFNYPEAIDEDDVLPPNEDHPTEGLMGYRGRLMLVEVDPGTDVGVQSTMEGGIVSNDGTQSTIYPLFELPHSFYGQKGNLDGFRLWAPTVNDGFDEDTAEAFDTRMYRLQFLSRSSAGSSPVITDTVNGESYVDFCFTPGAYSESTDRDYYADDVVIPAYEDDGYSSGLAPIVPAFSEFYTYQENIETVQAMVYATEVAVNPSAGELLSAAGQVDIFTGKDIEGDPHYTLLLEGPVKGGVIMGRDEAVYATGGADGTTNASTYEELVTRENENFGELDEPYEEMAYYPFSVIYDTGLSMEGKFAMMNVLGKRKDIRTIFTTLVEGESRFPSLSEEISREQAIMQRLRAYPESLLYGTPVTRGEIILQSGKEVDGSLRMPIPQVIDYACRWAGFAGDGTGNLTEGADIDVYPNNLVSEIKDLNVKFIDNRQGSTIWEAGGTWSKPYDRRSQYYPAMRSVNAEDTSVLLSPITVSIACDLVRLVNSVHAYFSGNAKYTKEQFIEKCDNKILELSSGKYGDRVQITPRTYFSPADDQRGYSWHCAVTLYANNPKTKMQFDLITRRMEDLQNG